MHKGVTIGLAVAGALIILLMIVGLGYFGLSSVFRSGSSTRLSAAFDITDFDRTAGSTSESSQKNVPYAPSSGTVPSGMNFVDYGTNVFIQTSEDRLSTFGLDIDTGSYTIAKNYIMRGSLPPTQAIRPEEFVNYFNYDYPNPEEDFAIYQEMALSPFEEGIHYLKIGIKSREVEKLKPVTMTLVIDVSGSMSKEGRIGLLKKSLIYLVNEMDENDKVGIVTYNTQAQILLEHTSIKNKQVILDAIDSLIPGGSTNAEEGLTMGYQSAEDNFRASTSNMVMLLSDGVANVGNTDAGSIISQLGNYKQKGITFMAIGVGLGNYNDVLLEQLADNADGSYAYINEYSEAERIFSQAVKGGFQIIARDAKIQVDFNPEVVSAYRLIGFENRAIDDNQFRNNSVDAGEIGTGHEVTVLYELKLTNSLGNAADITLRYINTDSRLSHVVKSRVFQNYRTFDEATPRFKLAVAVSRFAQILKLTAPPPSIDKVSEIVNSISPMDDTENDLRIVITNAKSLIELKR